MGSSQLGRLPAPRVVIANVYQNESRATVWEQAVFVVWFFMLYIPLPEFSLFRYACTACAIGLFAMHYRDAIPILQKSWPLLPYPILGFFSIFWSDYPGDALRTAMLQLLVPLIMVTIAIRLRPTEFLRVLTIAAAIACLYCIPYFSTLQYGGPLPQKNLLAYQFMFAALVSLATALNQKEKPIYRLLGIAVYPIAFYIQYKADSATSLVFVTAGTFVLLTVKLFWLSASKVTHLRSTLLASIVVAALAGCLAILMAPQNSLVADFLRLVGKDPTLTGRTGIWEAAEYVSKQNPWFGIGFDSFWQPNVGLAQTLNEVNHVAPGAKISFHSAFWEVRVHLGYVGLACFVLTIIWAGMRTIRLWLKDGSIANSAFLLFFFIVTVTCFTESYPAAAFSTIVAVFYIGAFAAFDVGARKLVGQTRVEVVEK